MTAPVLEVRSLSKNFGGLRALNDVDLDIAENEIVALIGPNGAGKTTAFNCITGVYEPTNGKVDFLGQPMIENFPQGKMDKAYLGENKGMYTRRLAPTPDKITQLGMARTFQNIRLWKNQTVFNNVLTAKHLRRTSNMFSAAFRLNKKEEAQQRREVMELLEEQSLAHLKDEVASSLPYGLQRRLEIARALATKPQLLLLDEPAAGMNPQETQELTAFIRQVRERYDVTVLLIEHHMDLVMDISDRIYVLDFGKLIAQGDPAAIQNDKRVIDAYLGVSEDA